MNKEKQKAYALEAMKALNLLPGVIRDFEITGRLYYSEYSSLGGILYWLDNEPEWERRVKEWEEKKGAMVYHAMHYTLRDIGEMLALLYIPKEEEDMEFFMKNVKNGVPGCYVINLTIPTFSEYGSLFVKEAAGGLVLDVN